MIRKFCPKNFEEKNDVYVHSRKATPLQKTAAALIINNMMTNQAASYLHYTIMRRPVVHYIRAFRTRELGYDNLSQIKMEPN